MSGRLLWDNTRYGLDIKGLFESMINVIFKIVFLKIYQNNLFKYKVNFLKNTRGKTK
jgi:hypothetical protein